MAGGAAIHKFVRRRRLRTSEMAGSAQHILEASGRGDTGEVERLIREGEDVNRKVENGCTPLHRAAGNGHTDTVKLLLDRGANIDDRNNKGNTPIHLAAKWGYTETVKLLLENGGDPYITNNAGETARDMDDTG